MFYHWREFCISKLVGFDNKVTLHKWLKATNLKYLWVYLWGWGGTCITRRILASKRGGRGLYWAFYSLRKCKVWLQREGYYWFNYYILFFCSSFRINILKNKQKSFLMLYMADCGEFRTLPSITYVCCAGLGLRTYNWKVLRLVQFLSYGTYLPRFGANATSCTASVIAIRVSTLCHFLKMQQTQKFQFQNIKSTEGN